MIIKIIGLVIGIMIFAFGAYYFIKEKDDQESKKIYAVTIAVGAVIAVICGVLLHMVLK